MGIIISDNNFAEDRIEQFDKTKIYEKLDYKPEPEGYSKRLSWIVQQQVAATNGKQYIDRIGKLNDYPEYELPVKEVNEGVMLDIGNGWGRWLVAGSKKGYIPVGIDLRLEFCETALQTLNAHGKNGYSVVADLKELPFKDNIFDLVWSFSVIQHTHKDRMINCLKHIKRILTGGGFTKLEFPNKSGFRKYATNKMNSLAEAGNYNSWVVRYYSVKEYKEIFLEIFNNFYFTVHSALGIGVLKEDLKYVSFKNKILCAASLSLSQVLKIIKPLKSLADSIYVLATKESNEKNKNAIEIFLADHDKNPGNNLNIIHLLQCPVTGSDLTLSEDKRYLVSAKGNIRYPIVNNIPIMIKSQALITN